MTAIRTIGVLTSGGDCAGLNAVINAVTHAAVEGHGWRVFGILDGSLGLMERPLRCSELRPDDIEGALARSGGTFLGTVNTGNPFRYPMPDGSLRDRSDDFAAGVRELGLDALVTIGGDGSMRILSRLCAHAGLPMLGIPKTIDNDVPATELAVGFSTAVQVVSDALDRLQPTAASHHRVIVVEAMGRDAGHIALHGGIAGGADVILLPELGVDLPAVAGHIRQRIGRRRHALVVIAEGLRATVADHELAAHEGVGAWLARQITTHSGVLARNVVLGHLQRGGAPCPQDRLLASALGVHAVSLLAAGRRDRMAIWRAGAVGDVPLADVTRGPRRVAPDDPMLAVARGLGISLGLPEPSRAS